MTREPPAIFKHRFRLLAAMLLIVAGCSMAPRWQGPVTDHFDGRRFYNPGAPFPHGAGDFWRYILKAERPEWEYAQVPPQPAPPARVDGAGELRATFINHATVLLQAGGVNVLTDPIFSYRASPVSWAGPHRYRNPGIRFEQLPPVDVVVISHNHFDHMDMPTLKRLREEHDPLFAVPLGNGALLRGIGIERIIELDWWQSIPLDNGCRLHAVPVRHWSSRWLFPSDRNLSLWAGWVLETGGGPVYFSGDTGYDTHFAETYRRFGPMRLALLPIGAHLPRWFMGYQHMNPAEAIEAHRDLRAALSLGIHWGTFPLAADGRDHAADELRRIALEQEDLRGQVVVPEFGGGYQVPVLTQRAVTAGCACCDTHASRVVTSRFAR